MKRAPSKNTVPNCWGRGPTPNATCVSCSLKGGCRLYARSRPKSLFELNETTKDEEIKKVTAEKVTLPELMAHAATMSARYGIRNSYKGASDKLDEVLVVCKKNDIDPKVWIEAQFHALGEFFKRSRMAVPKNCFIGGKSNDRYRRFVIETGRQATGNVRKQSATDTDFSDAEYEYGHAVLVLKLSGTALRDYEKDIKRNNPDWDKGDWESVRKARLSAAVSVCDSLLPGSSLRIVPPDRPWQWGELLDVLERVGS